MSPQQLAWRAAHYEPWYDRIGDGGPVAWIITGAYLLAAMLCLRAGLAAPRASIAERRLWLAIGLGLACLGINKQLDLQVALVEFWREAALMQGWYGNRRTMQWVVFALASAAGAIAAFRLIPIVYRQGWWLKLACGGLALVGAYIALRAATFMHLFGDVRRAKEPGILSVLELAGTALVAFAAWRARARGD